MKPIATKEFTNLVAELKKLKLAYYTYYNNDIHVVTFTYDGNFYAVSNGRGTMGGWSETTGNKGLLQLASFSVNDGKPIGWLRHNEVLDIIKKSKQQNYFVMEGDLCEHTY